MEGQQSAEGGGAGQKRTIESVGEGSTDPKRPRQEQVNNNVASQIGFETIIPEQILTTNAYPVERYNRYKNDWQLLYCYTVRQM